MQVRVYCTCMDISRYVEFFGTFDIKILHITIPLFSHSHIVYRRQLNFNYYIIPVLNNYVC